MVESQPAAALLPDSPRVVYSKNPLVEVICQVRFPPILRVVAEPPAAFQERIRGEYPLLSEKYPETSVEVPPSIPRVVAEAVKRILPKRELIGYDFVSADEKWRVALTRDFLALTCSDYRNWEGFQAHLREPVRALIDVYAPAFFTRIGLRYQDLIRRSQLGLRQIASWSELVKPHVAGMVAAPEVAGAVEEALSRVLVRLPQFKAKVRINYGIVQAVETNEESFLIDSDFYTEERTSITDVDGILSYFNGQSGKLFRWCIQDRLHEAMEPRPVDTPA